MTYSKFKEIIESIEILDATTYIQLIEKYGKDTINDLFEQYIIDESIEDNEKIKKTKYYVEKMGLAENTESFSDKICCDSTALYFEQLKAYPLLTEEEEVKLGKKLSKLKQVLQENDITPEKIELYIRKLNFDEKDYDLKTWIYLLNCKINHIKTKETVDLNKKNHDIEILTKIMKELKIYYDYQEVRNKFLCSNLRLVVSIAKKYNVPGFDFVDLIQEGNIGLNSALDKYEYEKGFKFSTYATYWIKQAITRAVTNFSRTIRIPAHLHELVKKVYRAEENLSLSLGQKPTDKELVEYFENISREDLIKKGIENPTDKQIKSNMVIDEKKLKEIRIINQNPVSINHPVGDDRDCELIELLEDPSAHVEDIITENDNRDLLMTIMPRLTTRERLVIVLRFGLSLYEYVSFNEFKEVIKNEYLHNANSIYIDLSNNENCCLTLEKIADILGITRERVRQIEAKGFRKLRPKIYSMTKSR